MFKALVIYLSKRLKCPWPTPVSSPEQNCTHIVLCALPQYSRFFHSAAPLLITPYLSSCYLHHHLDMQGTENCPLPCSQTVRHWDFFFLGGMAAGGGSSFWMLGFFSFIASATDSPRNNLIVFSYHCGISCCQDRI